MNAQPSHWSRHARQWSLIGQPLRPAEEDIRLLEQTLADWHLRSGVTVPRALLCGVTPEIARMRWPAATRLTAIDHSLPMITALWSAAESPGAAVCAEWLTLPLADASQHLLIGDGCNTQFTGSACYAAFAAELRRVAAAGALLAMRYFLRPERAESISGLFDDLLQQRIGNFHVFKWRLAMALHGTLEQGVRLGDVWDAWHQAVPDPAALAGRLGWPLPVINTIQNYRGVDSCYSFPTRAEARALAGDFRIVATHVPNYELGERCPTLIMQPV